MTVYFNERAKFAGDPGQQAWGGINRFNNCAPATALNCWHALRGNYPCSPQDITNAVYGPDYVGGELFSVVIDFMLSRPDLFPNPPEITINEVVVDPLILSILDDNGSQGFPMMLSFWCDINGQILSTPSQFQHASSPDYRDDQNVAVWNAEGYEQALPLTDFVSAFTGAVVVFHESCLPPAPPPTPQPRRRVKMEYLESMGAKDAAGNPLDVLVLPVAPDSAFNTLSYADHIVDVYAEKLDGTPTTSFRISGSGNQPGVKGPVQGQQAGSDHYGFTAADLKLDQEIGGSVILVNRSGARVTVWPH